MTISTKIIADSVNGKTLKRITTFELEYPRFIHSQLMTHRQFSRNSASSRAIPVERNLKMLEENPATPLFWGANKPGMQADEETNALVQTSHGNLPRMEAWLLAAESARTAAKEFAEAGYHKQIVNRLTEPFQHMKTVLTATEFGNFFYLRCDHASQPEMQVLARKMKWEMESHQPTVLGKGEWHLPYFREGCWSPLMDTSLADALAISVSCCAQVSYRRLDDDLEKAHRIVDKLMKTPEQWHASPFEHQARCMGAHQTATDGFTAVDDRGLCWSGNFQGWVQYRQLIARGIEP